MLMGGPAAAPNDFSLAGLSFFPFPPNPEMIAV
jgi:hypothetical protein